MSKWGKNGNSFPGPEKLLLLHWSSLVGGWMLTIVISQISKCQVNCHLYLESAVQKPTLVPATPTHLMNTACHYWTQAPGLGRHRPT